MTRTGYAWEVSNTPSDHDYPNPKALEGMMRAFDRVLMGKLQLGGGSLKPSDFDPEVLKKLMTVEKVEPVPLDKGRRLSFWHTFPLLKTIHHFRDNIRLRKYNREWSKHNPPMTIAEALSQSSDVINQLTSTHINVKH